MSIQILSDLHLESPKAYDIFEVVPKAPILALLGDIGYQLSQFRAVLLVPGNHEAYRSTWPQTLAILRAFEEETNSNPKLGQFVLLDRTVFRVPESDIVVLGCSLFSHVPPESADVVSMGLNDFFQTGEDWDVAAHNAAHARDVAWLNECVTELGQANARIIVFSHWSPSGDSRSVDPRHAASTIGPGFATDLSGDTCFASPRVKVWAFGHTHYNCDFTVERTDSGPLRLVTNQRGYFFAQAAGFDAERVLSLDG